MSNAVIEKTGPTLVNKQEDIWNIIIAHKDQGILQTDIFSRLSGEGKTFFQSNVSRDLAKLEQENVFKK